MRKILPLAVAAIVLALGAPLVAAGSSTGGSGASVAPLTDTSTTTTTAPTASPMGQTGSCC
jgi:hypothetical protein